MNHYLMLLLTKGYQSTIIQLVQYNKGSTINIYESPQHNFVCQKGAMPLNFVFVALPNYTEKLHNCQSSLDKSRYSVLPSSNLTKCFLVVLSNCFIIP
nr:hypothetical protein Iba_chr12dCG20920 [Ipomoea batatas]